MRGIGRIGSVLVFFLLLFVYSKWGPAIPLSSITQSKGEPMMVSAQGSVKVAPDSAKVNFGIDESGQSLKQVQDSVNKKSKTLVAEVKRLGIEEKDIKTISYNIYPESNYEVNPPTITGYRVSTNYQVTVREFDKVNELLTLVTSSGANMVGGISFEISDEVKEEKLNEARKEASDKAKVKAEGLAKAAGITLGKIINVSENQANGYPRPYALDMAAGGKSAAEAITQPEIEPGESELSVTVTLTYEVR